MDIQSCPSCHYFESLKLITASNNLDQFLKQVTKSHCTSYRSLSAWNLLTSHFHIQLHTINRTEYFRPPHSNFHNSEQGLTGVYIIFPIFALKYRLLVLVTTTTTYVLRNLLCENVILQTKQIEANCKDKLM